MGGRIEREEKISPDCWNKFTCKSKNMMEIKRKTNDKEGSETNIYWNIYLKENLKVNK